MMKLTQNYNLKRALAMLGITALMTSQFGCGKDDPEPSRGGHSDTPQKHNVELVYDNGQYQNIAMDTIYKYNSDPTVDTIFMIPVSYNVFSTSSTQALQGLVRRLRDRHNVNPEKVFGKGELQLWNQSVMNNPEIIRFFADTLKYNVTYRSTSR